MALALLRRNLYFLFTSAFTFTAGDRNNRLSRGTSSELPLPATSKTCMSAATKRWRYLRRIFHFRQMDFEFAFWQMVYLLTSPKRVYRDFSYRKHTKVELDGVEIQGSIGHHDLMAERYPQVEGFFLKASRQHLVQVLRKKRSWSFKQVNAEFPH